MTTTFFPLELEVEVAFTYDPGEPEIRYYPGRRGACPNGDGCPGIPPSVEIESVTIGEIDILPALTGEQIQDMEAAIMEKEPWRDCEP